MAAAGSRACRAAERSSARVVERLDSLQPAIAAARDGINKRVLLEALKAAGVAKMGQRQKAATVLTELTLPAAQRSSAVAAACATGSVDASAADGGFWASITEGAAAATDVECARLGAAASAAGGGKAGGAASATKAADDAAARFRAEQELWEREKARKRRDAELAAEEAAAAAREAEALRASMAEHDALARAGALVLPGGSEDAVSFEDRSVEERAAILRAVRAARERPRSTRDR